MFDHRIGKDNIEGSIAKGKIAAVADDVRFSAAGQVEKSDLRMRTEKVPIERRAADVENAGLRRESKGALEAGHAVASEAANGGVKEVTHVQQSKVWHTRALVYIL